MRLAQKASFCFLGRVMFRKVIKVMLEKQNPSHSCGAGPSFNGPLSEIAHKKPITEFHKFYKIPILLPIQGE